MIRTFCFTAIAIAFGSTSAIAQTGYYQPSGNPYSVPPRANGQMGDYSTNGRIPAQNMSRMAPSAPMMNASVQGGGAAAGCAGYSNGCAGYAPAGNGCDGYANQGCDGYASQGCDGYAGGCGSGCDTGGCGVGGNFFGGGCGDRYISLYGGWVDYYDTSIDVTIAGQANGSAQLEFNSNAGWAIGGAFGRRIGCNLRTELETGYRDNTLDSAEISFTAPGAATVFVEDDVDGRIQMYLGMYNVYWDFGSQCQRLRPYVGAGAGVAFIDARVSTESLGGIAAELDESAFAWQAMAGASWRMSDRAELFSEYRIFGTDDEELTLASGALGTSASAEFETMSNNVMFGVRFIR